MRKKSPDPVSLPAWAQAADAITLLLLAAATAIFLYGGYRGRIAGIKVSLLDPWRPAIAAVVLLVIRHLVARHHPLHRRLWFAVLWPFRVLTVAARAVTRIPVTNDIDEFGAPGGSAPWAGGAWVRPTVMFFVFWVLTLIMTYPQGTSMMTVRDPGDPYFTVWRLSWVAHQLPRDPLHLFDANIFYPERFTLAFSDAMLLPGLIGAPFLWLGMHQLFLSNLAVLATFVLSAMAMFSLVRALTRNDGAAFVAAVIFAFYPFRFEHYSHLELLMTFWMPLALLCLHRVIAQPSARRGAATGVVVAAQALSSLYFGIYLATWMVVVWGVLAAGARRVRATLAPLAVGCAVAGVLLLPLALPYLASRGVVGDRDLSGIQFYSAHSVNYLGALEPSIVYGRQLARFHGPEASLFPGLTVVVLAAVALWPPFSLVRLAYGVGLLFAFDASLGLNGITYPLLYHALFPFRGLRVPARFSMLVGVSLSVLAGYGVARITGWLRRPWSRYMLAAALAAIVLMESRVVLTFVPAPRNPPQIYEFFKGRPAGVIAELPVPDAEANFWKEARYEYFSTFHWMTLVNGNSGFFPRSYMTFLREARAFPDDQSVMMFRQRHVEFIVVHEDGFGATRYDEVIAAMARRPELRLVALDPGLRRGDEARIYQLR
ncbi:MAG: hypothetical protein NT151_00835 [Acidobacteria bacterium]|nr:hypothetical protein [Acidobacteriota bacterium]